MFGTDWCYYLYRNTSSTLFWPSDVASCHYSSSAMEWMMVYANSVNLVPTNSNSSNCPEVRPIEKYWDHIKTKQRKTCYAAISMTDAGRRWIKCTNIGTNLILDDFMGKKLKQYDPCRRNKAFVLHISTDVYLLFWNETFSSVTGKNLPFTFSLFLSHSELYIQLTGGIIP